MSNSRIPSDEEIQEAYHATADAADNELPDAARYTFHDGEITERVQVTHDTIRRDFPSGGTFIDIVGDTD